MNDCCTSRPTTKFDQMILSLASVRKKPAWIAIYRPNTKCIRVCTSLLLQKWFNDCARIHAADITGRTTCNRKGILYMFSKP